MPLTNIKRYDFYKYENTLKKGTKNFISLIDEALSSGGIEEAITIIKSSGLAVNIFNNAKRRKQFDEVLKHLLTQVKVSKVEKLYNLISDSVSIEYVFESFTKGREEFFKEFEQIQDDSKVAAYLISLEIYLGSFKMDKIEKNILKLPPDITGADVNVREALFNSATESTGMILKYFKYKNYGFKNIKRNISSKTLNSSWYHIFFSEFYNNIHDVLEYWQYSDVSVSRDARGKICFEIMDEKFELNNLVSNDRFLNLRQTWQMGRISSVQNSILKANIDPKKGLNIINRELDYLFGVLYFGDPLLQREIKGIKLMDWVSAYRLLISESEKFLSRRGELAAYNLDKVCICKPIGKWKKLFQQNGFSKEQAKEVIKIFTFDDKSQDLIDCPFIQFDECLVLVPSLIVHADPTRALASNFLNRNVDLAFRGIEFEERMKQSLSLRNINNTTLYKKVEEEYECDIVFELDGDLYFIECKAHVQPFSARQHANHLHKLYDETYQLNRIADFYEENIIFVNEKLGLNKQFTPKKVHRILLTTSMVGSPIYINGVHIVDESSFVKFIDRNPPALKYFENQKEIEIPSVKFDLYNGELSNEKFEQYLSLPPQIEINKDLYSKVEMNLDYIKIKRHIKSNRTMHIGVDLSNPELALIKKHFNDISFNS